MNRSRHKFDRASRDNSGAKIIVKNLPIDLEKSGLRNIFIKAGKIEDLKIIPPKDPSYTSTYGFIEYSHKTAAVTAIDMFQDYKIAGRRLNVKLCEPVSNYREQSYQHSRSQSRGETQRNYLYDDWSDRAESTTSSMNYKHPRNGSDENRFVNDNRISIGRGLLMRNAKTPQLRKNDTIKDMPEIRRFNLDRPYARNLYARLYGESALNEAKSQMACKTYNEGVNYVLSDHKKSKEFVIGEKYQILLTHVTTPSNFFVQPISHVPKIPNTLKSMEKYYKTEMDMKINDAKYFSTEKSSARCKLHNLIPSKGRREWSREATEILENLKLANKVNEILMAKVISCEEFESNNGRFEEIYGIDIYFAGVESVCGLFIDENLAIKVNQKDMQIEESIPCETHDEQDSDDKQKSIVSSVFETSVQKYIKISQIKSTKLVKEYIYKVLLIYFDQEFIEPYLYLTMCNQEENVLLLSETLQYKYSPEFVRMVSAVSELKVGDKLEALFDLDMRWYRGRVTAVNQKVVEIYFLDYGNSIVLEADELQTKLRYRICYKDTTEENIFSLSYQAVKCFYMKNDEMNVKLFVEKLADIENYASGFEIKVKEAMYDDVTESPSYRIVFLDEENEGFEAIEVENPTVERSNVELDIEKIQAISRTEKDEWVKKKPEFVLESEIFPEASDNINNSRSDLEVHNINSHRKENKYTISNMPDEVINLEVEINKDYSVCISHIVSVNEFFVQSVDNFLQLLEHQNRINILAELKFSGEKVECSDFQHSAHRVGDIVLAMYALDQTWYRCIITSVAKNPNKLPDDKDGYIYEVFFVDYGNTQSEIVSSDLKSIESLINSLSKIETDQDYITDLNIVLELPYQAICCQLKQKKNSQTNTDMLKKLMSECDSFDVKIREKINQRIERTFDVNKYIVNLYSENILLDDEFESEEQTKSSQKTDVNAAEADVKISETKSLINKEPVFGEKKIGPIIAEEASKLFIEEVPEIPIDFPSKTLELFSLHEFSIAFFGGLEEIYFHLASESEILSKLQAEMNDINLNYTPLSRSPDKNDFIMAKFYEEDRVNYEWYRAEIIDITDSNQITVLYLDYGNMDDTLSISDLRDLPEKFSLKNHPRYSYRIKLRNVELSLEDHLELLTKIFTTKGYQFKVISHSDGLYNVELWDNEMKLCINALIDSCYEIASQKDAKSSISDHERKISKSSIDVLTTEIHKKELTAHTSSLYLETFQKPFYFCLQDDMIKREELKLAMNEFYKRETKNLDKFEFNQYAAAFSLNDWYRVQIKRLEPNITVSNKILLYYIDYGFEEAYDKEISIVKKLDASFYDYPRYVFGGKLLDQSNDNLNLQKVIQFEDNNELDSTFDKFFEAGIESHELKIHSCLVNTSDSIYVDGEVYYGIQMMNAKGDCLNEMIAIDQVNQKKDKIVKKEPRPRLLQINKSDLLKQTTSKQATEHESFRLFVRSIDSFYIYEDKMVKLIQDNVKEICQQILIEQEQYLINYEQEEDLYNHGDLVFGKYEDEQTWYRCYIKNFNKNRDKFELFFIDYGNTEIVKKGDILYGWDEKHVSVFANYEPQALNCRLYALEPLDKKEFDDSDNTAFKEHIKSKLFKAKFIDYHSSDEVFEITLNDIDNENRSVHDYLTSRNLARYEMIPSKDVLDFWQDYFDRNKIKERKFS